MRRGPLRRQGAFRRRLRLVIKPFIRIGARSAGRLRNIIEMIVAPAGIAGLMAARCSGLPRNMIEMVIARAGISGLMASRVRRFERRMRHRTSGAF